MDYDDNDFQSQNFQLGGEDSSKFPSSLRSFGLPKFDLDEQLQVHLRFDSLVDTDALLDIHGHESNWIDNFSPGSVIEFSSSAAESCSVSRRNNVWSEATSSESVEMLLKSVGENEMLDQKASAKKPDTHEGLGNVENQNDLCSMHDDSCNAVKRDVVMADPVLPPDKFQNSYLTSNVDGMGNQSRAADVCQISNVKNSEVDLDDSSIVVKYNSDAETVAEQCTRDKTLASSSDDVMKNCVATKEILCEAAQSDKPSDSVFMEASIHDNHNFVASKVASECPGSKTCDIQGHPFAVSISNLEMGAGNLGNQIFPELVTAEQSAAAQRGGSEVLLPDDSQKEKGQIISGDIEMNDRCPEGHASTNDLRNEKVSSNFKVNKDPPCEGCKHSAFSENTDGLLEAIPSQVKVMGKICEVGDKSGKQIKERPSLALEVDGKIERLSPEIGNEDFARMSHLTEGYKDAGEHLSGDDGSQIPSTALMENAKLIDKHGDGTEFKTLMEETSGKPGPESQLSENTSTHKSSVSGPAMELHCSINMSPETPVAREKNEDSIANKRSDFTLQHPESALSEKHAEDKVGEKSEVTVNVIEAVILEKSPSVLHNDVDTKNSSSNCKSSELCEAKTLVSKLYDGSVIPPGDSLVGNTKTGPDSSGSMHSNGDDLIVVEASVGQNAATLTVVDDSLAKIIQADPDVKDVILPTSVSDSVQSDEKGMEISGISCLSTSKSIVDVQNISGPVSLFNPMDVDGSSSKNVIQDESFASLAEYVELTSHKKSTNVDQLHSENSTVSDMVVKQKESALSLPALDTFHTNDGEVKTSVITCSADSSSQDEKEATSVAPSKSSMGIRESDAQDGFTKSPQPCVLSDGNVNNSLLEAGDSGHNFFQPNGGRYRVIGCSEYPHSETDRREESRELLDKIGSVPNKTTDSDKIESTTHDSKNSAASVIDKSFTFAVGSLAEPSKSDNGSKWKPFFNMQSAELVQVSKEKSRGGPIEYEEGKHKDAVTKRTEKATGTSGGSTGRGGTSKRKPAKETSSQKQTSGRDGNLCSKSRTTVGTISRDVQLEQLPQYPCESSSKASCSPAVQTSSLPDLNASISPAALFHQPFTDLQQVQLRAQIFVYGSLIQGTPPEEACMLSAFGDSDGRNIWDAVWHAAVARFQKQKSSLGTCETPVNSHSGVWVPDHVTRFSSLQGKSLTIPVSQGGAKVTSGALGSTVTLSSPLWSVSACDGLQSNVPRGTHLDFNQVLSPVYSYQSSQVRQYSGSSMPWLSQTAHIGSLAKPTQSSTLDVAAHYSMVPTVETIHATPVRESSVLRCLGMQPVPPSILLPASGPSNASAASVVQVEAQEKAQYPGNGKNLSSGPKSRKKKKVTVPEGAGSILPISQAQADPASVTGVTKPPISTCLPLSISSLAKVVSGGLASTGPHIFSPTNYQIIGGGVAEQRAVFSEETCTKIEQAKLQAEDAASLAASAVRHSQAIWSLLATQKNSGLASEVEEKLASAAVAAATAASVAKAAAEAAKVASDAALQAKMMADEALNLVRTGQGQNMAMLAPISILKGKDKTNGSNSILTAAREAARERVEAACAATKRAENLDAIVKAAELAAEAVSQAGMIVTVGDPLPFTLNELVEYGPEGYWKLHQSTTEKNSKTSNQYSEEQLVLEAKNDHDSSAKKFKERLSNIKEFQKNEDGNNKLPTQSDENYTGNELRNVPSTVTNFRHEGDHLGSNLNGHIIQKGSLVEIVSDEEGLTGVWFSAHVLEVKDGKAYVCYNDLCDKGSGQLKKWIPLDSQGDEAPRVRIAHPITSAQSGATRKRRRDVVSNYTWAVGDHVDAWIRDSWWEGIVEEKNKEDKTKLTIHISATGDSSAVRAWDLRPSLIWKDGQWIEWSCLKENSCHEGDTPQEKRQRLGRSEVTVESEIVARGVAKLPKDVHTQASRKPEESRPLPLSANDKFFSAGTNGREENNIDSLKVKQTGLQKQGSGVIFGVPKPGKKRKFMEVSKHYVADKTVKMVEGNDSIKFAKYLMPQSSRIWGNASKVDRKGKGAGDSKPKGPKSLKSQNIEIRSTADKDNSSIATLSFDGAESRHGSFPIIRTFNSEENVLEKKDVKEAGSVSNTLGEADNLSVESSVQPLHVIPSSKKKSSAVIVEEVVVKGKHTPSLEKLTRSEEKGSENPGKTIPDAIEPRRSNRRIQPTSRLLEGLQSSLLISKIPSVSHDKGAKALHRAGSSSRGNAHG